jgi:hypothetical protein
MTIKHLGGIFGRNPTFNEVTADGNFYANDNIIMADGKGIDFSATSGTGTSELFDDYEEGTWTPVPADALSGGNTGSATVAVGSYTKVGRLVHVTVELNNINTSGLTAGNRFYIQGLPYAASNESGSPNYTSVAYMNDVTFSSQPIWLVGDNTSTISVLMNTSGGSWSALNVSALTATTSDIELSITYQAAV